MTIFNLFFVLCYIQTLEELSLRNNRIDDEGAEYLAEALRENTVSTTTIIIFLYLRYFLHKTLTTLNLSKNSIGDNGIKHLADALRENTVSTISVANEFLLFKISFFTRH